jgi:hypothetical protein
VHERLPSQAALELLTGQLLQPHALIDCQVACKAIYICGNYVSALPLNSMLVQFVGKPVTARSLH